MPITESTRASSVTPAAAPWRFALAVAGGYAVVGMLWILLSDHVLTYVVDQAEVLVLLQSAKGVGFVVVTATLLAVVVYRRARALARSQQALAASHENLRAVLDSAPLPTCVLDDAGRVRYWNSAAERLLGWSAEEMLDCPCPFLGDDQKVTVAALSERCCEGERFRAVEGRVVRKDGRELDLSLVMAPLEDAGGAITGAVVMGEDQANRQHTEHLRRQRDLLRRDAEAMHEAVGVIGHELRTPLASLRATLEYVQTDVPDLPEEAGSLLGAVEGQVNQLTDMVNNMLEAARLNSGAARWQWSVVAWQEICQDVTEILKPLIDPRRVTIETEIEPAELTMQGDAHAIRRLVLNLLNNAHKHTSEGTIRLAVREAVEGDTRWVEMRVTDTGKGISRSVADQLGRAFALNRGSVGTEHVEGAGLGLAICKGIVAAHGGSIGVRTGRNEGTTFTVLMRADLDGPLAEPEDKDIRADVAA